MERECGEYQVTREDANPFWSSLSQSTPQGLLGRSPTPLLPQCVCVWRGGGVRVGRGGTRASAGGGRRGEGGGVWVL